MGAPAAPPPAMTEESMPGYRGMWIGISLEFIEFTVFFAVYFTARGYFPQVFREGAPKLWTLGGLGITLVMLTSGWMLTRTVAAVRAGRLASARAWVVAALAVALCYPLLKLLEIEHNRAAGVAAGSNAFFTVYYYLTINHFIHSSWGIMGMAWVTLRLWMGAYSPGQLKGLESLAIYWHATDLVWIMLFSLFYAFV